MQKLKTLMGKSANVCFWKRFTTAASLRPVYIIGWEANLVRTKIFYNIACEFLRRSELFSFFLVFMFSGISFVVSQMLQSPAPRLMKLAKASLIRSTLVCFLYHSHLVFANCSATRIF